MGHPEPPRSPLGPQDPQDPRTTSARYDPVQVSRRAQLLQDKPSKGRLCWDHTPLAGPGEGPQEGTHLHLLRPKLQGRGRPQSLKTPAQDCQGQLCVDSVAWAGALLVALLLASLFFFLLWGVEGAGERLKAREAGPSCCSLLSSPLVSGRPVLRAYTYTLLRQSRRVC